MADVQGLFPTKIGDGANSGDYVGVTTRSGLTIEGVQADGAAIAANPVVIAGSDGVNVQTLLTDNTGALFTSGVSDATNTGTITALNGTVSLDIGGRQGAAVLISGTWSATLEFQISTDDGVTYTTIPVLNVGNDIYVASSTANGLFVYPTLAGMTHVQVIATAFTSGTVDVRLTANNSAELLQAGFERANGGTVPYRGVQMGVSDGTNLRYALGDTGGRQIIVGAAADGAAVTGNPVLIGGDDGTNAQSIAVDTSGRLTIVGAAADGAAAAGNPVLMAGSDGSNAETILVDSTGRQVIIGAAADGAAVTGNPVLIGGSDGTNAQNIAVDTSGRLTIVGAAADGAAVTGNPVLIAGTDGTNAQTISTDTNGYVNVNATVTEIDTGTVAFYDTATSIANNNTGTLTYTTSAAITFYLKTVIATASAGPCKVVLDYGAGPTVIAVGFITDATPVVQFQFGQPVVIPASTAVNVKITNRAGQAQDVYATIIGREV